MEIANHQQKQKKYKNHLIGIQNYDDGSSTNISLSSNDTKCLPKFYTIKPYRKDFYRLFKRYGWIFPLFFAIILFVTIIIIWLEKIFNYNTHPLILLISDIASKPPIAGYFSQVVDTYAILNFITIFIRYKQIKYYIKKYFINSQISIAKQLDKYNFYSILFGIFFSLGYIIIGNFRFTEQPYEHALGYMIASSNILAIFFMIRICLILSAKQLETRPITMICSFCINFISFLCSSLCISVALFNLDSIFKWLDNDHRFNWPTDSSSYVWYIIGIIFEWLSVWIAAFYYLSLSNRMRIFSKWNDI